MPTVKSTEQIAAELEGVGIELCLIPGVPFSSIERIQEAADRLRDLEKIAEFYRKEAEKNEVCFNINKAEMVRTYRAGQKDG